MFHHIQIYFILLLALFKTCSDTTVDFENTDEEETNEYAFTSDSIPQRSKDDVLQILCFTSSWGVNSWYYIPYMLRDLGIKFRLEAFYVGGSDFSTWEWMFAGNSTQNIMHFVFDNSDGNADFNFSESPDMDDARGMNIVSTFLKDRKFDVIFTQQGAVSSVTEEKWKGHYRAMCKLVRNYLAPNGVIVFNSTWSPSIVGYTTDQNSDGESIYGSLQEQDLREYFERYGLPTLENQKLFQQDSWRNTQEWIAKTGITVVVPNGSLMYMLRNNATTNRKTFWSPTWEREEDGSYVFWEMKAGEDFTYTRDKGLDTEANILLMGHDTQLCPDGLHPAAGLPSFALALDFFATVFTPMYGIDIEDITWRPVSMADKKMEKAGTYAYVSVIPGTTIYEIPLDKKWDAVSQSYVDDESQSQFHAICKAIHKAQECKFSFMELEDGDASNYVWK